MGNKILMLQPLICSIITTIIIVGLAAITTKKRRWKLMRMITILAELIILVVFSIASVKTFIEIKNDVKKIKLEE